jgi:aminoglycoside N3'-acetyltransferase
MPASPASRAAIATDLRRLGLAAGSVVMVHASLRAVGPVAGGADGVIDAIESVLGADGTMLMLLGARDDHAWVNQQPESERVALLAAAEPFDALVTPADPAVGVLAEVFRQRSGTRVSDHPEGRFAAAGPAAAALLDDVPWDDYFGPGSPLERLIAHRGTVLRLGADPDTVTALHYAEYLATVEPKRRVRRHRSVKTAGGAQVSVVESLDDEHGIVDYPGGDYFADILRAYLATAAASTGNVGAAHSELIDAADLIHFGVRWMDEQLRADEHRLTVSSLHDDLDAGLRLARRRHSQPEIAAIRSLKSALANAEAVPVPERSFELVQGSADVPRRRLTPADIATVIQAEIAERQRAIEVYRTAGADTTALELELASLWRYHRPR